MRGRGGGGGGGGERRGRGRGGGGGGGGYEGGGTGGQVFCLNIKSLKIKNHPNTAKLKRKVEIERKKRGKTEKEK